MHRFNTNEITGLLETCAFNETNAHYKVRFIVQRQKDNEKGFITHISNTGGHKHKVFISISIIHEPKAWNQDFNRAYNIHTYIYIYAHDPERGV